MAIKISGDGSITGVSVGGLPDGTVDTDTIAANAINDAKLGTKTFVSYAVICDQKAYNVDGGTFTQNVWTTRDLNTTITDSDGIVSINSNQFTLGEGSYLIKWSDPAFGVNNHNSILWDVTDVPSFLAGQGTVDYGNNTYFGYSRSFGSARVSFSGNRTYEIQHHCATTKTSNGLGVPTQVSGYNSIYTIVEIYKEA